MTSYRILCLSGMSGVGKTTLQEHLAQKHPGAFVDIPSYTTRERRIVSEPNYRFVSLSVFREMQQKNAFAWTREIHGNWYGTCIADIEQAFSMPYCSVIIISPDCVPILAEIATRIDKGLERVLFLHLWSPGETTLARRLARRGDSQESITRRIIEGSEWDHLVASFDIPFRFILNNQTIQYLVQRAEKYIFEEEP